LSSEAGLAKSNPVEQKGKTLSLASFHVQAWRAGWGTGWEVGHLEPFLFSSLLHCSSFLGLAAIAALAFRE